MRGGWQKTDLTWQKTLRNHKDSPLILLKFDLTYLVAHSQGRYLVRRLTTVPALDENMCAPQEDKGITIVEQGIANGLANGGYFAQYLATGFLL